MDTCVLQKLFTEFLKEPVESMSQQKMERLYYLLLSFQLENQDDFSDEFNEQLTKVLDLLERELNCKMKDLPYLRKKMIEDPSEVELILSGMDLLEVLRAEQRGKRLRSPELRQQFANMITRRLEDICMMRTTDAH